MKSTGHMELLAVHRFEEMTGNPGHSRAFDAYWFVKEVINGSLVAYYVKKDAFVVLIDGEQIDES